MSHFCGCITFTSEHQVLWYAKIWPNRVRDIELGDLLYQCPDLIRCKQQQDEVFGFIPFTALNSQFILQDRTPTSVAFSKEFHPVECHKIVKASGTFNCLGSRIQLSENINFQYLESLGPDYLDQQLFTFLRYGFPLNYNRSQSPLKSTLTSHNSARQFPEQLLTYLTDERAEGAMFGPYAPPPPPPHLVNIHMFPRL